MTSDLIERLVVIAAGILSMTSLAYSWITWRSRANAKRIFDIESRVDEVEGSLKDLEVGMLGKTFAEVGQVHNRVDAIDKRIGRIEGEVKAIAKTTSLINQHLLDRSAKE